MKNSRLPLFPDNPVHRCPISDFRFQISAFQRAFTLIELLVVISIIIVLMALLFPAFKGVQDQAKKTQAKNDLMQIVNATNAFYTEYGTYPVVSNAVDYTYDGATNTNDRLFNELRGVSVAVNTRNIAFLSPPSAKDLTNPRGGISQAAGTLGQYMDPWGKPYVVRLDTTYDNQLPNPYSKNAGSTPLYVSVIAWSFGKDQQSDSVGGAGGDKNAGIDADDVISWQ